MLFGGGWCAIAYRHLVWNSPVGPAYKTTLSTGLGARVIIILGPVKASFFQTANLSTCLSANDVNLLTFK